MNRFKVEAYISEFPFLTKVESISARLFNSNTRISIRRADENLLSIVPHDYTHTGSMGCTNNWQKVSFVLSDGTILEDYVTRSTEESSNYAGSVSSSSEGETILEAVASLEDPDQLEYIILESREYDRWQGSEEVDEYTVTVYKAPKGVKYSELIAKARAKALSEVRAEADF